MTLVAACASLPASCLLGCSCFKFNLPSRVGSVQRSCARSDDCENPRSAEAATRDARGSSIHRSDRGFRSGRTAARWTCRRPGWVRSVEKCRSAAQMAYASSQRSVRPSRRKM
eukprot:3638103-Prymnesium_polylepis.1